MKYHCTDAASDGEERVIEAPTAQAALREYIADAWANPECYNQGEEGVDHRIDAWVRVGDTIVVDGVIDFSAPNSWDASA